MLLLGVTEKKKAEFDPTTVSGLLFFGEARKESYNDNDDVTVITDFSGNGNDFTVVNATKAKFSTNQMNGHPVYFANATDIKYASGSSLIGNGDSFTFFYLAKSSAQAVQCMLSSANNNFFTGICCTDPTTYRTWTDANLTPYGITIDDLSAAFKYITITVTQHTADLGTINVRENGVDKGTSSSFVRLTMDNLWLLGTPNSATQGWRDRLSSALLYTGEITGTDRTNIENYLKDLAGL